ncbi:MAG: maleylpyruvate isomerase N-terminal domain-containing protein, partial [Nocardioides sp.]
MSLIDDLLHDLTTEGDSLRAVVAPLADEEWATDTPAEGWTIATTIAHLLWTDEAAVLAARAHDDGGAWDKLVLAG